MSMKKLSVLTRYHMPGRMVINNCKRSEGHSFLSVGDTEKDGILAACIDTVCQENTLTVLHVVGCNHCVNRKAHRTVAGALLAAGGRTEPVAPCPAQKQAHHKHQGKTDPAAIDNTFGRRFYDQDW